MRRRLTPALVSLCVLAALAAPAARAAPPLRGVLVPGQSLGGLRIGMTKAEVKAAWGTDYGRCRSCARLTWYYNYRPFTPQGAGVAFLRGKVVHVFTLWQPAGWKTAGGLTLGALEGEVTREYAGLARRSCSGYEALQLPGARAQSVFYLHDGTLWGFGLTKPAASPCV